MASTSEKSFGARYENGRILHAHISSFVGYNPPQNDEKPSAYAISLDQIMAANNNETTLETRYSNHVDIRYKGYKGKDNPTSVLKLLAPIRTAVIAQYGKKSFQAEKVTKQIQLIRNAKIVHPPADPASPNAENQISKSEQSFGSISRYAYDLVLMLTEFGNYAPVNASITITALNAKALLMQTYNTNVYNSFRQLRDARILRRNLYIQLRDVSGRIKAHVQSQYGFYSNEYTLIKGLKF